MADAKFEWIDDIKQSRSSYIAGQALFRGILKGTRYAKAGRDVRMAEILRRWRLRVSSLECKEWKPAKGLNLQYLRNCRPHGLPNSTDYPVPLRVCRLRHICPWCWGRHLAANVSEKVDQAIKKLNAPYRLGLLRYKVNQPSTLDAMGIQKMLDLICFEATQVSDRWKRGGALGGCSLSTVYPNNSGWCTDIRILLILPEKRLKLESQPWKLPKIVKFIDEPRTRDRLYLLSRFAQYPGVLLTALPSRLLPLLDARAERPHRRYFFTFGCCYKKQRASTNGDDSCSESLPS